MFKPSIARHKLIGGENVHKYDQMKMVQDPNHRNWLVFSVLLFCYSIELYSQQQFLV